MQTTPCLSDVVSSLTHSELVLLAACCRLHLSPNSHHMKLTVGDMTRIYDQFTGILTRKVSVIYYIIRCTAFLYMHAIFMYAYHILHYTCTKYMTFLYSYTAHFVHMYTMYMSYRNNLYN